VSHAKPLWGEGLFLRPQNFQQQDDYHERRLTVAVSSLQPFFWGLRRLKFDHGALATGMLRLTELSLVFPDGEQYDAPHGDEPPAPIKLNDENNASELIVSAALPLQKELGGNLAQAAAGQDAESRYSVMQESTADLYTKAIDADISYLRKNVRLVTGAPSDHLSSVPILRLRRTANAGYEVDSDYIVPALSIQASSPLQAQLKHLLDALQAKISALYGFHREPTQHIIEFRSGDVASFWLLHTANAAHATLMHLYRHPQFHPERLFQELLRLAGSLMTFSKEFRLADLPTYDHARPGAGFEALDHILRELLETVISTRYFSIALQEQRPTVYVGRLDSGKIDNKTELFLAVKANLPAAQVEEVVPSRFKLGSPDDVDKLVLAAMPGVALNHASQVPAAIPIKPGTSYFSLQRGSTLYEAMLQSQSIAIYAPGVPDLKLELIAVTQ